MADRFILDSMIHDKLIDEPEILERLATLVEARSVEVLSTHVQRDQLARTPDAERAERLGAVPVKQVPTYGMVADVWRAGEARVSEDEPFQSLREGNLKHTEDALIAATAQYEDAILVTEDRTLKSRAHGQGISVMNWAAFRALVVTPDNT
jgi:hypothetical protein